MLAIYAAALFAERDFPLAFAILVRSTRLRFEADRGSILSQMMISIWNQKRLFACVSYRNDPTYTFVSCRICPIVFALTCQSCFAYLSDLRKMALPDRLVWCVGSDRARLLYQICMAQSLSSAWWQASAGSSPWNRLHWGAWFVRSHDQLDVPSGTITVVLFQITLFAWQSGASRPPLCHRRRGRLLTLL
jgi:hypothetical protein